MRRHFQQKLVDISRGARRPVARMDPHGIVRRFHVCNALVAAELKRFSGTPGHRELARRLDDLGSLSLFAAVLNLLDYLVVARIRGVGQSRHGRGG